MYWARTGLYPIWTAIYFDTNEVRQATEHAAPPALPSLMPALRPWSHEEALGLKETFVFAEAATLHLKASRIRPSHWPSLYWRQKGSTGPLREAPRGTEGAEGLHEYWVSRLFLKGTLAAEERWMLPFWLTMDSKGNCRATSSIELYMAHNDVALLLDQARHENSQAGPVEAPSTSTVSNPKHDLLRDLRPMVEDGRLGSPDQLRNEMYSWCRQHLEQQPHRSQISRWARELWNSVHGTGGRSQ